MKPPSNPVISFSLRHPAYAKRRAALKSRVLKAASATLSHEGIAHAEFSILLTDDSALRELNRNFRGRDKPTNVLSFPGEDNYLGDIAISLDTVTREACEQGKTFEAHLSHLVVHAMLHLLGMDHEMEVEARRMEKKEILVLQHLKISNPYV